MAVAVQSSPPRPGVAAGSADVVLILGYTSWSGAVRRSHIHPEDRLTTSLMTSHRVGRLLVCNPFRSHVARAARRLRGHRDAPFPGSPRVRLHEPRRLRMTDPTAIPAIERQVATYERSVRRAAQEMGLDHPAVIVTHPLVYGFGDFGWAGPVTYYANDDLSAHPPLRPWWPAYGVATERARAAARHAVGLTPKSLASVSPGGRGAVVPSGIDPVEWASPGRAPAWFLALPAPRLVYVGTLDERLDLDALGGAADAHPGASVVLIGRCPDPSFLAPVRDRANVQVRAEIPRRELTAILAAADAGLVPHVVTEQTRAMSPLKLYEYLAAGTPVAAVDLPGIAGVEPGRTALAGDSADFADAVARALALGPAAEADRLRFISDNAWEERAQRILDVALDA